MKMKFRFQELLIWQNAIALAHRLADIADSLDRRKLFRYAEQLRSAALSVSNNIAEGSGSVSNREFANFLNIARRSCFELANMTIFFQQRSYLSEEDMNIMLETLDHECRMLESFRKKLRIA